MGQGLYRCVGFGCLSPPPFDFDNDVEPSLFDILNVSYEAEPPYVLIPFGIDDRFKQVDLNLPPLPKGLPHVGDREAVVAQRCEWWPDVGKTGVWVSRRIEQTWELVRVIARSRGWELPEGYVIFVCDWD